MNIVLQDNFESRRFSIPTNEAVGSRGLLTVVSVALIAFILAKDASGQTQSDSDIWRLPNRCGVNCTYLFLRSHGEQPDYDSLCHELLASTEADTSLADIEQACKKRSVWCKPMRLSPSDLQEAEFPIILHLDTGRRGHFILALGADQHGVSFVDGTSGKLEKMSSKELSRQWTGYALTSAPYSIFTPLNLALLLASFTIAMLVLRAVQAFRERKKSCDSSIASAA